MFSVRKHITKALLQTRFYSAAARSKVYASPDEAVKDVKSGDLVLSGGFGICGIPDTLISALQKRGNVKDLTVVSNNCGIEGKGLSKLLENGQISKFIGSYVGGNKFFEAAYLNGELELELTPREPSPRDAELLVPAFQQCTLLQEPTPGWSRARSPLSTLRPPTEAVQ